MGKGQGHISEEDVGWEILLQAFLENKIYHYRQEKGHEAEKKKNCDFFLKDFIIYFTESDAVR